MVTVLSVPCCLGRVNTAFRLQVFHWQCSNSSICCWMLEHLLSYVPSTKLIRYHFISAGVDWKVVARFCDVSRSYKTFQNPNDASENGPKTWRAWFMNLLTLPGVLPRSVVNFPGKLWRTISGREKEMKLGKHTHAGHGEHSSLAPCHLTGLL